MNASVMSSHTQKPKSVLNKISTQMNYKLSHKWGSSSKHMWTVQVKSMKKVSNKAPASPYFLVSQCLFIPAVVAESKFESEGKSVCTARKGVRAALSCEYLFPWEAFLRPRPQGRTGCICIRGELPLTSPKLSRWACTEDANLKEKL